MPIFSMTGFGRDTVELAGVTHVVELRAVNHRFLDLRMRLPRTLSSKEALIRGRVGARLTRGRIDLTISAIGTEGAPANGVRVNWPLARAVRDAHRELADRLGVPDDCDSTRVASWPGVLTPVAEDAGAGEEIDPILEAALDRALDALVDMRAAEGLALADVLRAHLENIEDHRGAIEADAPAQARAWQARFEKRLKDTLANTGRDVDEGRLLHEVAVFAEKTDVAEELARLTSHLDQARLLVDEGADDGIGRRLDFMCQEMLRETNTIGSKVQAVELTRRVVDVKAELERLREQVQNVE